MSKDKCDKCGKTITYGGVCLGESPDHARELCEDCYNEEIADRYGIKHFSDYERTYRVKDCDGKAHTFAISQHIFPMIIQWEACELIDDDIGYKFVVHAQMDENPKISLRRLYQKVQNGLSKTFIEDETAYSQKFYTLKTDQFTGRIEWDDAYDGRIPQIVIDGKTYSWEQIGEMMMTYEGFIIKVQIKDIGDDKAE